jgi:hypothetical protein
MRTTLPGLLLLVICLVSGCKTELPVNTEPRPITEPEPYQITRDSITSGTYLGITIGEEAASVYPKIQLLQRTNGVTYLNVVSNIFSDLALLKERLPLYQYIVLDQNTGSSSGVQITIQDQIVKSIYLNSGQKLSQWPERQTAKSSVRVGDPVSSLYDKLVRIKDIQQYTNTFERMLLLTKNLYTAYDPGMDQSPQWYFGYPINPDQTDQIQVHFRAGRVSKLYIEHYTKYK